MSSGEYYFSRITLRQRSAHSEGVRHGDSWGRAFTAEAKQACWFTAEPGVRVARAQ